MHDDRIQNRANPKTGLTPKPGPSGFAIGYITTHDVVLKSSCWATAKMSIRMLCFAQAFPNQQSFQLKPVDQTDCATTHGAWTPDTCAKFWHAYHKTLCATGFLQQAFCGRGFPPKCFMLGWPRVGPMLAPCVALCWATLALCLCWAKLPPCTPMLALC